MTARAKLTLEFTGYWISGTGAARGRDVDAVTYRDADKLPAMPMTQAKGILRETAERLEAGGSGLWTPGSVVRLFGARSKPSGSARGDGALGFIGDARLAGEDTRAWLARDGQKALREKLFAHLPATAIDEKTGAALDHSLRAIEAAVPVTLEGFIHWVSKEPPDERWVEAIDLACAATVAFGKLKGDGYGRVIAQAVSAP
jgi:hypothetical protein